MTPLTEYQSQSVSSGSVSVWVWVLVSPLRLEPEMPHTHGPSGGERQTCLWPFRGSCEIMGLATPSPSQPALVTVAVLTFLPTFVWYGPPHLFLCLLPASFLSLLPVSLRFVWSIVPPFVSSPPYSSYFSISLTLTSPRPMPSILPLSFSLFFSVCLWSQSVCVSPYSSDHITPGPAAPSDTASFLMFSRKCLVGHLCTVTVYPLLRFCYWRK